MAKKITGIKLNNYRAYYDKYDIGKFENGENVLIYGENGSGKSSLYKSLFNFFTSSNNRAFPFVKNRYRTSEDGWIELSFSDYDLSTNKLTENTENNFIFGSTNSTNNQAFIQSSSLVKGFLDYTDLLKVYFYSGINPNLFDLIVLNLLGDHIPVATGGNFRFSAKWTQLQSDLTKTYSRSDNVHKRAKAELSVYQTHLNSTLLLVFTELNRLLVNYFPDLNLVLGYDLQPIIFNYTKRKHDWYTTADLRLQVSKDGIPIQGDYSDGLNEARLSAISVCLYLASLLVNPTNVDVRILYLDDVFIGLDAGNRLPILSILKNEFSGYQIFISTYDRHWFELSKRYFELNSPNQWKCLEMYVGQLNVGNIKTTKPLLVSGKSNFEKSIYYLHHRVKPDYPAAANYLRKGLEELIQKHVPKYELANVENVQFPDHKLTTLLYRTRNFLNKIGLPTTSIDNVLALLNVLIHPLSHYEISSPIYKAELQLIIDHYETLLAQLMTLDLNNDFKCVLEPATKVRITFVVDQATQHVFHYEVVLKETVILLRNPVAHSILSKSACYVNKLYGYKNGNILPGGFSPRKEHPNHSYTSLKDATDKIYAFVTGQGTVFVRSADFTSDLEYYDIDTWKKMAPRLVW
ncbi:energy-coupling factor transporter ATP-binding protein EcfA2 [Mucilaginibacter sp. SG538B]|uniref:ATP-binding protein n=1 Tax=Mucilaginibacter sp. SG538B TaxID=2587021 RepID=UPI00159E1C2A|nr:ATP-binding protein [Mucilaginibacter sp. SG538B]NVM65081.1 energy-coupling factor transporter ATP-binding protein EcfA2 [Mucilaginibacter sp. SG538B]